jgi:hypothetical protein
LNRFFVAQVTERQPQMPPPSKSPDSSGINFVNHLFISYAQLDNARTEEDEPGWVDRFHTSLKAFLSTALGEEPIIWRDPKLKGTEVLWDEIATQLPKTAVLVSIISPRYLKSQACLTEVNTFCQIAESQGGLVVDNQMRISRVMLMPLDTQELRDTLPGRLKEQLGYPFYDKEEGGRPVLIDPRFGEKYKYAFNRKLYSLAAELAELINKIREERSPGPDSTSAQRSEPAKPVIYLAECSWDREDDREKLWSELRATGYTVLPEQGARLPDLEEEYAREVEHLLDRSQLSIHIIGTNPSTVLNGPGRRDAVQLQNEIAARKSQPGGLSRLIWLPPSVSPPPEQQSFIDALRSKSELQQGADLIEDNLEGFKNSIRTTLEKLEEPPSKKIEAAPSGQRTIYLICVPADRPTTVPLRKYLHTQGLEVELPIFEASDAAGVRQYQDELLNRCDAVLMFYGAGSEAWYRTTESDLEKIKKSRKGKPVLPVFTYLASPPTDDKKDRIEIGEPNLINGLETFSEATLQPFLDALKET